MNFLRRRHVPTILLLAALAGCTQQQNTQELKEKTAQATAEVKHDAEAVAAGIREGWSRDKPLDLNTATKDQLLSLPGVNRGRGRPSDCRASLWRSWRRGDAAHYAQDRV